MSLLLGGLLLVSGSNPTDTANAAAPTAQAPAQAPAEAAKADKNEKKICRREESTESRVGGKRICLTAEQWKRADQSGQ